MSHIGHWRSCYKEGRHAIFEKLILSSRRYTPDVVFLQELIPPYVQYLKKRAVSYLIIEGTVCSIGLFSSMLCDMSHLEAHFGDTVMTYWDTCKHF